MIRNNIVSAESWKNLLVGDSVLVLKDQRIPADLLLISSSNLDGAAYIDTSTLDGEKHLKPRFCCKETIHCLDSRTFRLEEQKLALRILEGGENQTLCLPLDIQASVHLPPPSSSLHNFEGSLTIQDYSKESPESRIPISLSIKNFLFKGTLLKNTSYIIGVVIYSGSDTKIQQNGATFRSKVSRVEKKMHKMMREKKNRN